MLHNVKKSFILTKIQMLFSENPDVYVKKTVQIRTQRPQITLIHICLFLSFFKVKICYTVLLVIPVAVTQQIRSVLMPYFIDFLNFSRIMYDIYLYDK